MYRNEDQRDFARRLRNQMTEPEERLWRLLRAQQLHGHKFRRQAAIGPYVVDFVCFSKKLIIELDGPQHCEPGAADQDTRRTNWLNSRGFRVLRFRNHQLDEESQSVADEVARVLTLESIAPQSPLPNPPREGEGAGGIE
jgi:very-short-patch-repair endonuclease